MIYLASASPRRAELLRQLGLSFSVVSAEVDETCRSDESPHDYVARLALEKARAGWSVANAGVNDVLLSADTSVVADDHILGKPVDENDALTMWQRLSDNEHQVLTGVCCKTAHSERVAVCTTRVWMRAVSATEWRDYWRSGEPRDKAGGYAIQGLAARFITRIDGSYSNVVGLPLHLVDELLHAASAKGVLR